MHMSVSGFLHKYHILQMGVCVCVTFVCQIRDSKKHQANNLLALIWGIDKRSKALFLMSI